MTRVSSRLVLHHSRQFSLLLFFLCALALQPFLAKPANAQDSPVLNLDVPFVPTPNDVVNEMLRVADVGPDDALIDLGSGDGRIAIAAVRDFGAKSALGVDLNPDRVSEARAKAEHAGVTDRVRFDVQNLFDTDLSEATVISMYLLPRVNLELRPRLLELQPGTRLVSHAFSMGEWEPDAFLDVGGRDVYFWVVPAKLEGKWLFTTREGDFTAELTQNFQKLTGSAVDENNNSMHLTGQLHGDIVTLNISTAGGTPQRYIGKVQDGTIIAMADDDAPLGWQATKR